MEKSCLGRALQTYDRNNVSPKSIQNKTNSVEEVNMEEENKLQEEIFPNENVVVELENSYPEPDISESMKEELQENTSESTDEINLKTFMENTMKENEIHKTNIYENSKKIHWNENMLKRCLGAYYSASQNTKKTRKTWKRKESNICDENVVSKNEELISSESSYDIVPQEDHMLDSQIYTGETTEKVNEENEYYYSTGSESNNDESDENEKSEGEFTYSSDNESYEQDSLGKFEKISWSIISDIDEEDYDGEMDSIDEDIQADNESSNETDSYEGRSDVADSYGGGSDDADSYEDGYENDYEDSYVQEDLLKDKYHNGNNGTDQYFSEAVDDNFESDYQENEVLAYSDENEVYDFEDMRPVETLDLEIANNTIDNTNWDNGWDECDVLNNEYNDIETVGSFIDYRNISEDYDDYDFDCQTQIETPEYMSDYDQISYGQSVECRIIT
ncbi:hypothetical protein [Pseudobacteroides cellulosolvens]|uniref:Uncharacterized protein n=1 Tax=Pseudobacteroides cellulosolvens ATCC 35603 = DSM 2933 TaxID=398512 RepID=A0A0L6JK51_9FIRM|nr:hypothetical protein [Pseudobacteroides cellulosolvens]KNY26236.1 hypothetical protein Bccel_1498 [Pseudobacteroides cellulosolvens ATCC 35603 = DSM 2933]